MYCTLPKLLNTFASLLIANTCLLVVCLMLYSSGRFYLGSYVLQEMSRRLTSLNRSYAKTNNTVTISDKLALCPIEPPGLVGPIAIDKGIPNTEILKNRYFPAKPGGHFKPRHCEARNKTAVIVAFRDREKHLLVLLNNLIPLLVKQQVEFAIFVIEPVPKLMFNRALLMNVGFVEALKTNNFTCFVFHDVDLIPENDRNLYRCGDQPRHMAVARSSSQYRLPYTDYAGGVLSMSRSIYTHINGQSNIYFGWGGEDDDTYSRLTAKGYKLVRYPAAIGRYIALTHGSDKGNPKNPLRTQLSKNATQRMHMDGLNSLEYKTVKTEHRPLYTWVLIDIDMAHYNISLYRP